jgi:DNA mismatch endonuclease (patch repair protein)
MADTVSRKVRSQIMSRIRGTGNERTDKAVASMLRKAGIVGWRRHVTIRLPSTKSAMSVASDGTKFKPRVRPDFLFPKHKVALFIDGCFWHGCPRCYTAPKSARGFWKRKVTTNRERDRYQTAALRKIGWRVVRMWEHHLAVPNMRKTRRANTSPLGGG